MEILFRYLLKERDLIDEYRIWVNTKNPEDLAFFDSLEKDYPGFVSLDKRWKNEPRYGEALNIGKFFDRCTDDDTVYVRLDDDVVWLSKDFIRNLVEFRINNPEPFLVYPTIINNAICDHILQSQGYYGDLPRFTYHCMDNVAWKNSHVCELKHREMLEHISRGEKIAKQEEKWVLKDYERVSINCISWLGETFSKFQGVVGLDEENWLSSEKSKELGTPNVITGDCECSHFAFYKQREHMDKTDILKIYDELSRR